MNISTLSAEAHLNKLDRFRRDVYNDLGPARDALFELTDAILLTPAVHSFAELGLSPVFRRRWPSLYEALQDGRPDRWALLEVYLRQLPITGRIVLAGDHTAWPRLAAVTLADRTVEHQPTKIPNAKPITVGQGFSTLAWVTEGRGSWALPLLHERIASSDSPLRRMIVQLEMVCPRLPKRPLVLLDAEYGCAPFVNGSAGIPCDKLIRLRSNLALRKAPTAYKGHGRRPKHGAKFKLNDPTTWEPPDQTWEGDDPQLGRVRVQVWQAMHFKKAAEQPFSLWHIERLDARGTRRDPKAMWVCWLGASTPPIADGWRGYLRRFAIDHWYRFAKQSLYWTLPHLKTPQQAECWSDLMPFLTWELWLARPIGADKPRPWQKPQIELTPGRVRQGMGGILARIGTPACAPKPRGKALGWPKGRWRCRAQRHPIVKKSQKRQPQAM